MLGLKLNHVSKRGPWQGPWWMHLKILNPWRWSVCPELNLKEGGWVGVALGVLWWRITYASTKFEIQVIYGSPWNVRASRKRCVNKGYFSPEGKSTLLSFEFWKVIANKFTYDITAILISRPKWNYNIPNSLSKLIYEWKFVCRIGFRNTFP